jgi:type I restriction enzyme M protein
VELLKLMGSIPVDIEGDALGRIHEYSLGNFPRAEGQKCSESFTLTAIAQLIGGMFVQSARFVG